MLPHRQVKVPHSYGVLCLHRDAVTVLHTHCSVSWWNVEKCRPVIETELSPLRLSSCVLNAGFIKCNPPTLALNWAACDLKLKRPPVSRYTGGWWDSLDWAFIGVPGILLCSEISGIFIMFVLLVSLISWLLVYCLCCGFAAVFRVFSAVYLWCLCPIIFL